METFSQDKAARPERLHMPLAKLRDPDLPQSWAQRHVVVPILRALLSPRGLAEAQEGRRLCGLMRGARLTCRGVHCSRLMMDKANRKSPFWMSSGLEGFMEEVGLEPG